MAGHTGGVKSVSLSGDGQIGVSGGEDGTVKVWDVRSGKCLSTLSGHHGSVGSVAISRDGKNLFTGSEDQFVKRWDISGVHKGRSARALGSTNHALTLIGA